MSSPKVCLDTHPLIWYFTGQKTLSSKAREIIDRVFSQKTDCFISSIVLLEAFHLSLKKRDFVFAKFLRSLRLPNIIVVPLDKIVLSSCYRLPANLDIHDRVISATSIANGSVLVTKDQALRKIKSVKTLW